MTLVEQKKRYLIVMLIFIFGKIISLVSGFATTAISARTSLKKQRVGKKQRWKAKDKKRKNRKQRKHIGNDEDSNTSNIIQKTIPNRRSSAATEPNKKQRYFHHYDDRLKKGAENLRNYRDRERNFYLSKEKSNTAIDCQHFSTCSGCIVNEAVDRVRKIETAKDFFSSELIQNSRVKESQVSTIGTSKDSFFRVVVPSSVRGWRTQAKLAVAPSREGAKGCTFGLYQRGTHTVVQIPRCEVHHPSINLAIRVLERATQRLNIVAAFNDKSNNEQRKGKKNKHTFTATRGGLRYVQCQVERSTNKVSLTLVWHVKSQDEDPSILQLVKELQNDPNGPDLWHNIWYHYNDNPGNTIFARGEDRWHRLTGPEFVREPLPAIDNNTNMGWLYFSPLAFRQGNMDGFDILARDVAKLIPGGSRVCELYAGIGLLGLTALAHHGEHDRRKNPLKWVRCSDENPANSKLFHRSMNSLPKFITMKATKVNYKSGKAKNKNKSTGEIKSNCDKDEERISKATYMVASAKDALLEGEALGADILIVDPPRKGLGIDVLNELSKPINLNQKYAEKKKELNEGGKEKINWVNNVHTLIYVSCGFDALQEDCCHLVSYGNWKIKSACGYVLFPGSDHVETLVVFQRKIDG